MPPQQSASSSTTTFRVDHLRYVVVFVYQEHQFPPAKNSATDIALIRAANCHLQRKQAGIDDSFLFVFPSIEAVNEAAIHQYGFSNVELRVASEPKELMHNDRELFPIVDLDAASNYSFFRSIREEIGEMISVWLEERHPTAIPFLQGGYDPEHLWWQGIEHQGTAPTELFETSSFSSELPSCHKDRAITWLAIARNAGLLSGGQDQSDEHEDAYSAAALCEWLNGYNAMSEVGENGFEGASVMRWLPVSELALGFEAARITEDSIWPLCDEHDRDIGSMAGVLLKLVVSTKRSQVRDALSEYFGGDPNLFFSLQSIISPDYSRSLLEQFNRTTSLVDHSYDELADAWNFVQEGWHDRADADYDA